MPELPEVETVVRGLRRVLIGRTVSSVRTNAPPSSIVVGQSFRRRKLESLLPGRSIGAINRRGKNILISLSGDVTLWVHLKMTGKFRFVHQRTSIDRHDLVIFNLTSGKNSSPQFQLRFNDYRRFGRLRLYRNSELWQQPGLAELGPEPLELHPDQFVERCHARQRMIKPALLDQTFIAGIGNIYADESLHLARIHPRSLTSAISRRKLRELHSHIQQLLENSIRLMGTTVDSYAGVNGETGSFQRYLKAYNNEGRPCDFCGSTIIRKKIGSRSAHYCPRCQRER